MKASAPEVAAISRQFQADLFVVVAYGEILKKNLLEMPSRGCINIHASILPKYRGAAPMQHCLMNGEAETGVTIMHMAREMDAGDIIKIVKTPIGENINLAELEEVLCKLGSQALLDVISDIRQGKEVRIPQDHSLATFAPKIESEQCRIDWQRPARDLHNLVRGVVHRPGAWCTVHVHGVPKRLKVHCARLVSQDHQQPSGTLLRYEGDEIIIACGQQALRLLEIQLEGKKSLSAAEFIRGFPATSLRF
jgi:methionyl-tRNA formyltransferase